MARRLGEYSELAPTSADLVSTLVDTSYNSYAPSNIGTGNAYWNAWVRGGAAADAANVGLNRRTSTWTASSSKASFLASWPTPPSTGTYEVYSRNEPRLFLSAINAAISQLGFYCQRDVIDSSLLTVQNQWLYTLPASQNWLSVDRVEMQISLAADQVGYPYADAIAWNYKARKSQNPTTGVETWELQFGNLPPQPPRIIRVYGSAFFSELANDADVLPLGGAYEGISKEFIYGWGTYVLYNMQTANMPSNQSDRYLGYSLKMLEEMQAEIRRLSKPARDKQIIVPGRGDGLMNLSGQGSDWQWLGAYNSAAFAVG